MLYTFKATRTKKPEMSFEDIMNDMCPNTPPTVKDIHKTVSNNSRYPYQKYEEIIKPKLRHLDLPVNRDYRTFTIPKKSDPTKRRQISEPNPELKTFLRYIKEIMENDMYFLPHNAAHAYVPKRSVVTAMKEHQDHKSRWFLKLDIKDFFPNHNKFYIMKQLKQVYPFGCMLMDPDFKDDLESWVDCALLRDGLPQGTPLSPLLTNITMVPIDYAIEWALNAESNHYTYTRYADDLIISCKVKFDPEKIIKLVEKILRQQQAPFKLNKDKIRFGSINGRNWNFGIMLNKDNNMTIGFRNNKKFRAKLFHFFMDNIGLPDDTMWSIMDVQHLIGLVAWYKSVQPEITNMYLKKYSRKFGVDFDAMAKDLLRFYNC